MTSLETGLTFQFTDRPNDDHLYVIISNPDGDEVVIVNVTTKRRFSDISCILQPGDCAFVEHESCIAYKYSEVVRTDVLRQKHEDGDIVFGEKLSTAVMDRIWEGAATTRDLSLRSHKILADQNLI